MAWRPGRQMHVAELLLGLIALGGSDVAQHKAELVQRLRANVQGEQMHFNAESNVRLEWKVASPPTQ